MIYFFPSFTDDFKTLESGEFVPSTFCFVRQKCSLVTGDCTDSGSIDR